MAPAIRSPRFLKSLAARLMQPLSRGQIAAWSLVAAGCSGRNKSADATYIEGSVEELYNRGMDLLLAQKYKDAAKFFTEVDRQHPYSEWARKGMVMSAFASYRKGD